jgi:hypothetical protein
MARIEQPDFNDITRYVVGRDYYKDLNERELETVRTKEGEKIQRFVAPDGTVESAWHVDRDRKVMEIHPESTPDRIIPATGAVRREMTPEERSFLDRRGSEARVHQAMTPEQLLTRQGSARPTYATDKDRSTGPEHRHTEYARAKSGPEHER